jgi:putative oxidoreductase
MGLASTTLRLGTGGLLAGHGLQKLGKLGGDGLEATAAGFEHMGFRPGRPYATAAAVTEAVGGTLVAAGLLTPLGAAMTTGVMTVAIGKVHGKNGLWITKGGMEYNLAIIATVLAITESGPGHLALDGLITKRRKGIGWALAELVVGVASGAAVMALANRGGDDGATPDGAEDAADPVEGVATLAVVEDPANGHVDAETTGRLLPS